MGNSEYFQCELDFGDNVEKEKVGLGLKSQNVLDKIRNTQLKVSEKIDLNQGEIKFKLTHLFGGLINKGEYFGVQYFKLKNNEYSYKGEKKINLEGFGINGSNKVRYFIIKIGGKKYKINLGDYTFNKGGRKINDGTAEGFEVSGTKIESLKIDSIQKGVSKGFSEIKSPRYFSYLLGDNSIITTMNFPDYIKTVVQDFLKTLINQI